MDVGFETIGNATLICHDRGPVLVTDPWFVGDAYFGSWNLSHEIPDELVQSLRHCRFVWVSHGHPDHLSMDSLAQLRGKAILVPDHAGGRIRDALASSGFAVTVLPDRRWVPLSERIKVMSIADYNQDGILLADVGGRLVVNLNDACDRGWRGTVKRVVREYDISFLLRLSGFGDADMMNLFDEEDERLVPKAARRVPVGRSISWSTRQFGTRYFIPFSSMHRYQRADSLWANEHTTDLDDYRQGFESTTTELLPAFVRYDCARDSCEEIAPPPRELRVRQPEEFGDHWADCLDTADRRTASGYFRSISHLESHFDFVNLRVGGEDNVIELAGSRFDRGITFEAPRHSLMKAINGETFDDMLIGNFMRTTLHGTARHEGLYPHFTPYVAKYADNGRARSEDELAAYRRTYRQRASFEYLRHRIERRSMDVIRSAVSVDSLTYQQARRGYRILTGARR